MFLAVLVIFSMILAACAPKVETPSPEEPPAVEEPVVEKPAEEKPAEEKPAEEPPAVEEPVEEVIAPLPQGQELANAYAGMYAGTVVTMAGPFTDQDAVVFNDSIAEFEAATGIDIQYEGSKEF